MCNLVEDKYRIASMILVVSRVTIMDILKRLELDHVPDAVYTVLGELLEKELLEVSHQTGLIFNQETHKLEEMPVKLYQIIPGKEQELEQYVAELDKQRLQPNAQGKPRGLNYRVLEQLIVDINAYPEKLQEEEVAIEQYLALAQSDEMSEYQSDLHQKAISEAYLRTLYGQYLQAQQRWAASLVQILKASQLFNTYGLQEKYRETELLACEILVEEYERAKRDISRHLMAGTLEFVHTIDNIIKTLSKVKFQVFLSLAYQTLKELRETKELKHIQLPQSRQPISRKMHTDAKVLIEQLYSEVVYESSLSRVNESKKNLSSALVYLQRRDQSQPPTHTLDLEEEHKLVTRLNLNKPFF